jgi:hypothetical protein
VATEQALPFRSALTQAAQAAADVCVPLLEEWQRRRLAEAQPATLANLARSPFEAAVQYPELPPLISSPIPPQSLALPNPVIDLNAEWRKVIVLPSVIFIIGKRGSGKTATAYRILDIFRYSRPTYVVGAPPKAQQLLPEWIGLVPTLEDLPPKSIALIDESHLLYHSRESMSAGRADLSRILNLSRQRDQTLIFVSQEARQVDKNIASSANVFVVKDPGMLQAEFDRPELRTIVQEAKRSFASVRGDKRRWSYVFSPDADFVGMLESVVPTFWKPSLSQLFADASSNVEARDPVRLSRDQRIAKANELRSQGDSFGEIAKMLGVSKATVVNYVKGYPYQNQSSGE